MKWIDNIIARSIAKALPASLRGDTGWQALWGNGSNPFGNPEPNTWPAMTPAELEAVYKRHPIVRACVSVISKTVPKARLEIGMDVNGEWKPLKSHPTLDLLEAPNPEYSRNDFFQYFTARAALTGFGYAWAWRNQAGSKFPVQLWPIPTSWVTRNPNRQGGSLIQDYKVYGNNNPIPPQDMLVARYIDPTSTDGATSPLEAALHDYRLDRERENYQADMLKNLRLPGPVFKFKRPLSPESREDIKLNIMRKYGPGHRYDPLVLDAEGEMDLTNPLSDIDWPGITGLSETRICVAYGTPPIVIHARAGLDRATYSNYLEARKAFYIETMAAVWDMIADALTLGLLRNNKELRLKFRFRYDELPEFNEDAQKLSARTVADYNAGLITLNEGRARMHLPPVPEGNEFKQPSDPFAGIDDLTDPSKKKQDEEDEDNEDPKQNGKKKKAVTNG